MIAGVKCEITQAAILISVWHFSVSGPVKVDGVERRVDVLLFFHVSLLSASVRPCETVFVGFLALFLEPGEFLPSPKMTKWLRRRVFRWRASYRTQWEKVSSEQMDCRLGLRLISGLFYSMTYWRLNNNSVITPYIQARQVPGPQDMLKNRKTEKLEMELFFFFKVSKTIV